jgi:hypothetical protein
MRLINKTEIAGGGWTAERGMAADGEQYFNLTVLPGAPSRLLKLRQPNTTKRATKPRSR